MSNTGTKPTATGMTSGDVYTLESRTSDGKAISTLLRISLELSPIVDDITREAIEKQFQLFCNKAEELF